ncbi:hypothetical protein AB0M22_14005 [Nocardia sp. NPDC051756]|uniref:hypothetical protein n=1 Tax=Nocardia sp. NPDC051756 TaxID=3154751 RepID=UPI003414C7EB
MKAKMKALFPLAIAGATLSLTLGACGTGNVRSSDITITVAPTTTAASTAAGSGLPKPLTAAELDKKLQDLFGKGEVADDARLAVVQGGEAFRGDLTELRKAMSENPNARFGVVADSVQLNGDILEAEFWLDKDGNGNRRSAPLNLAADHGDWKIPKNEICGILAQTDYKSPACK